MTRDVRTRTFWRPRPSASADFAFASASAHVCEWGEGQPLTPFTDMRTGARMLNIQVQISGEGPHGLHGEIEDSDVTNVLHCKFGFAKCSSLTSVLLHFG